MFSAAYLVTQNIFPKKCLIEEEKNKITQNTSTESEPSLVKHFPAHTDHLPRSYKLI